MWIFTFVTNEDIHTVWSHLIEILIPYSVAFQDKKWCTHMPSSWIAYFGAQRLAILWLLLVKTCSYPERFLPAANSTSPCMMWWSHQTLRKLSSSIIWLMRIPWCAFLTSLQMTLKCVWFRGLLARFFLWSQMIQIGLPKLWLSCS